MLVLVKNGEKNRKLVNLQFAQNFEVDFLICVFMPTKYIIPDRFFEVQMLSRSYEVFMRT